MKLKTELKTLKALGKILSPATEPKTYTQDPETTYQVQDLASICMIIGLSDDAKRLLCRFIEADAVEPKIPNLDYSKHDRIPTCKYSSEYLVAIMNIFKALEEPSVRITMQQDYPSTFENNDFKIILAPRCEQ